MTLNELNIADITSARRWFEQCCASSTWIELMVKARPFKDVDGVTQAAVDAWSRCDNQDYLEAFLAHPMIGDVDSLRKKFANTKAIAAGEQSGTSVASEEVLQQLKEANKAYLDKHGFIFIICATGLSADTMLHELNMRLPNTTEQEIETAAAQQIKITLLRLNKALA
jgi:2-oxo-4-hydroxy-4-carboxy-5-ureidoimidazoline decarboxylase